MFDLARYSISNEQAVRTPALLFYPDIIRQNTLRTIDMAGGAQRLWPHIKSHKTAELISMQRNLGIDSFKCATLSELRLVAQCGAKRALLAYPLIGPNVAEFMNIAAAYGDTQFFALEDSAYGLDELERECARRGTQMNWLCDVNLGMNRTGVKLADVREFVEAGMRRSHLRLRGLHCYDGHNHISDLSARSKMADDYFAGIDELYQLLNDVCADEPIIIAGGSPTFVCHTKRDYMKLSPGTVFLWDSGYARNYPDLPFEPGAALLARVISHPDAGMFTLDLGSKSISTDPEGAKGELIGQPFAAPVSMSEEHWCWRMADGHESERPAIGKCVYVIPTHICPAVALHSAAHVVAGGAAVGQWRIAARDRL